MEGKKMPAKRNDSKMTITKAAIVGLAELQKYLLANPTEIKYPTVYPKNHIKAGQPHPKAGQPKSTTARQCTVQTPVTPEMFVRIVEQAASYNGALDSGDLEEGMLGRAVRYALIPTYAPEITDIDAWESARAEASSEARGKRMAAAQAEIKKVRTLMDKLGERAASNPALAAMLAELEDELIDDEV